MKSCWSIFPDGRHIAQILSRGARCKRRERWRGCRGRRRRLGWRLCRCRGDARRVLGPRSHRRLYSEGCGWKRRRRSCDASHGRRRQQDDQYRHFHLAASPSSGGTGTFCPTGSRRRDTVPAHQGLPPGWGNLKKRSVVPGAFFSYVIRVQLPPVQLRDLAQGLAPSAVDVGKSRRDPADMLITSAKLIAPRSALR